MQGGASAPVPRVPAKPAGIVSAKPAEGAAASPVESVAFPLELSDDESTHIADLGALAGAFSLAVGGGSETAQPDTLSMPADEWFVGINGVPVGPIRLSELRSKAASGSVTRDSLVWRDGFEDWRPLGTFPELVAIVDESLSSARASLTPFTPSVAHAADAPLQVNDPFVTPASPAVRETAAGATPSADAYRTSGVTGAAVVTDELQIAGVPKRGQSSLAAWVAIVMALLFGLTMGFVFFRNQSKTVEIVKYVPVPGAPSVAPPTESKPTTPEEVAVPEPKNPVKHSGPGKVATPTTTAEQPGGGIKNLPRLGPGLGPETGSGPSGVVGGGAPLDGAQIQSTVARYTGSVKRACWQPALDTRDKDAPTTARVNVTITVLPSGSVQNAAVNGDPRGYRGLSQCISSRVRGWQFPPSGDTTTVNVPFVFAAQ